MPLFIFQFIGAQNHLKFKDEVVAIQKKYDTLPATLKETIVFTGSSSIRLWGNLPTLFPKYHIINSGFGGSVSNDLLFYTKELILNYKPKKVFVYVGDNDIYNGIKTKEIIINLLKIINQIKKQNANTQIILISAKPSIKRWHLKKKYQKLNRKQKQLTKKDPRLHYADVWSKMIDLKKLKIPLFSSDGLHMNTNGYDLWHATIKEFINL